MENVIGIFIAYKQELLKMTVDVGNYISPLMQELLNQIKENPRITLE